MYTPCPCVHCERARTIDRANPLPPYDLLEPAALRWWLVDVKMSAESEMLHRAVVARGSQEALLKAMHELDLDVGRSPETWFVCSDLTRAVT